MSIPLDTLRRWTALLVNHAERACFTDDAPLVATSDFVGAPGTTHFHDTIPANEWDTATPIHLDPDCIKVKGVKHVGGSDISYRVGGDPSDAIVAKVVLEYPSLTLKHTFMEAIKVDAPYVPSFLAVRELDHVEMIYDKAVAALLPDDLPEVIFVDGFGRWHERQAGLATALGVERGIRTIGIGKEYQPLRPDLELYSGVKDLPVPMPPWPDTHHWRSKQKSFRQVSREVLLRRGDLLEIPLYQGGPAVGAAVYTAPGRRRQHDPPPLPAYISPGHRISLESAVALTMTCCVRVHSRLPEPIILADRLGRDEMKRLWG